jgi:general secretion pathway protein F
LLQLADTFEQAQQMTIKRTMSLLTPLLTLGLGLLVGALMLSLMSAITGLNDFALR